MGKFKRWYDEEPTMSLAVSMLKSVSEDKKNVISHEITAWLEEEKIPYVKEFVLFKVFHSRWYDEDKILYELLERVRCTDEMYRKEIAVKIIDILCVHERMEMSVC